ncbi:MAG: aminopeptidase P family protein [Deltaproteobacteria bacterium]|nr:aminopeptidase P family protein [Deltaproteobacteria bacterium]
MDTLHTVLNRGRSVWDRARLPEEEFRRRLNVLRAGMKERGVDLLLVYGDSWKYGNLAYVSHFIPKNRGALAVIPMVGEPALVIQEPSRNNPFSTTLTWIQEVHSVGKFAQGVSEALKVRSLKPKRLGVVSVEQQLNIREWRELGKLFEGVEWRDLGDHFNTLRGVKSEVELTLLRQTIRILEEALAVFRKSGSPGQKEYEIAAEIERAARRQGVEDFRLLLARSGQPEIGLRPAGDSPLKKGEAILVLAAASYQRYWAELGQTICLGRPPDDVVKSYDVATRAFRGLVEGTRAGVSPAAATACLNEVSSPTARDSLQAYGLGNGLGLDLCEEPVLGKEGNAAIKPGMALTLRACFTGKECGSAFISRPYLVAQSGLEALSRIDEKLVTIGD